jgi:hypothetical protein
MALTKIGKEGITGISNASDATFLTATSGEGVTLAGTLAVTGVHTVGSNAVATSDGGAVTTSIVQGLLKVWCNIDGDNSTLVRDSFNIGSTTDRGSGAYTFTLSNNMASVNNAITYNANPHNATNGGVSILIGGGEGANGNQSTSAYQAEVGVLNNGADQDSDVFSMVAGDLA